jgi:DNA-directed RNA polymerase specialized sigma24 family protein
MRKMERLIMQCQRGECSFADFIADTRRYWECAARDFLRRWDHPPAIEEADLVQEMLVAAWIAIERVDPARGNPRKYVVFSAAKAARRWFHRQRGAKGFARSSGRNRNSCGQYPKGVDWIDKIACESGKLSVHEIAELTLDSMKFAQEKRDAEILDRLWKTGDINAVCQLSREPSNKPALSKQLKIAKREIIESLEVTAINALFGGNCGDSVPKRNRFAKAANF